MTKAGRLLEILNSEKNTPEMRKKVEAAAWKHFQKRKGINVFFEHGHWWVGLRKQKPQPFLQCPRCDGRAEGERRGEWVHYPAKCPKCKVPFVMRLEGVPPKR
jgi:predicted Zn-ribbon and HTH transcriptional regulator